MNGNQFHRFQTFLETLELPSLGPEPRRGRAPIAELDEKLKAAFAAANTPAKNISLIRSLVLLWHDHLNESHTISQDIHTPDGSFLHGVMHRREPDYWNSKYWFQRVGAHPAFSEIARRVSVLLKNESPKLLEKLVPADQWDAFAFIDECEEAMKNSSAEVPLLQHVQEIEFRVLLEQFCK